MRVAGVTCSCSSVPRSRSRTMALAVNWMSVKVRMIAMRPGMMKLAVFSSGLYQGRTRRSTGRAFAFQPARCARMRIDRPFEIPAAIDMAWLAVVVSEALTMSSAFAGAPRWMSLPKSRSMTRPTDARAPSIQLPHLRERAGRADDVEVFGRRHLGHELAALVRARLVEDHRLQVLDVVVDRVPEDQRLQDRHHDDHAHA